MRTLPRQCPDLLPPRHRRRAIHDLLYEIPIDGVACVLERIERTFAIRGVARHGGRTAHANGVGTDLTEGVWEICVRGGGIVGGAEGGVCVGGGISQGGGGVDVEVCG